MDSRTLIKDILAHELRIRSQRRVKPANPLKNGSGIVVDYGGLVIFLLL